MKTEFNLSPADIKAILLELGYELQDRGTYWQTNALYRQGDNKTALQIYKNTGVWRDFVENTPPLPFRKLLETHLGSNDPRDIGKYLKVGYSNSTESPESYVPKISDEEIYPEECLKKLLPHYSFYTKRGIGEETLKAFKGGLATQGAMYQRFVFPIYNEYQQIHGFSGRDMASRDKAPKWKHLGKKRTWVYPYYVGTSSDLSPCAAAITSSKSVILVESIGDMLNLYENGFRNVLVTFGLDLSSKLMCHLMSLDLERIIISFNNDDSKALNPGVIASIKVYLKLLNHFDLEKLYLCLPIKNDFGDMSSADFVAWAEKCRSADLQKQSSHLRQYAQAGHAKGLISKNLYKNTKKIEDYLDNET